MSQNERAGNAPKYGVVANALRQRIDRGQWAAGTRVPSLHELAEEFGVARLTARQAVQLLVEEGLLDARRGSGTVVTGQPRAVKNIQVQTTLQALGAMYLRAPPEIRTLGESRGPLPPAQRRDDTEYVCLQRVHSEGGVAYCVITLYIDAAVFALAPRRFRQQAVIPVLLAMPGCKVRRAHQTMTVGTADTDVARHLGVAPNAPVAFVERVFEGEGGHVIYLAEVIYRGEAVRLEIDLTV
ncbi:GntR family transcriptional regulator [Xylophilus rhododendri]|uniref:GntR family transcriptional regulator n=1 Tax=Xylophilus rhododendri TaxID=2697032 RepID=A0A857JED2_9BURK|nr:GntR family transcriptional regulator [Xylophilus rhododendri]QHJ01149.1 GntR family transcriptional regulator [Xylophilus rhododendri]